MSKKYVLFDLDGTLTDSCEGITKSVCHALETLGIYEDNMQTLLKYIGPPLDNSFRDIHGLTGNSNAKAVAAYRARYNNIGLYENSVYSGMEDILKALKNRGYILALATCKPEPLAIKILEHFHLDKYFTVAVGSELEGGTRRYKNQVIEEVFIRLNEVLKISPELTKDVLDDIKADSVMVGDRKDDILGAKNCQIESLGVRYGFSEADELEEAGADYIVDSVVEIIDAIEQM